MTVKEKKIAFILGTSNESKIKQIAEISTTQEVDSIFNDIKKEFREVSKSRKVVKYDF